MLTKNIKREIFIMKIVKTIKEVREIVKSWKSEGNSIGFVATMGYLHEGHASLIDASVNNNDKTVVSIFVNPMQFGANEDLSSYPRDLNHDSKLCQEHHVDLIFNPEPSEMYGEDFYTYVNMDVLPNDLCGITRPIHFKGVCTVVNKLFNIVQPNNAYFGQKDAQQLAIIKQMVKDLNMPLEVHGCPIVREADGLAKSSRNTYLNAEERQSALILSKAIQLGENLVKNGERDCSKILTPMVELISSEPLAKIDYVKIVDLKTIQPVDTIKKPILCAMAVYIGKTRLIDNFIFEEV